MSSKKIQDATRRLAALADKLKVTDPEEYQQKVIKAVRGPLEEAIKVLREPSTADPDYMVNPNDDTAEVDSEDNSAGNIEIDDDDDGVDIDDGTIGVDDNVVDDDNSNVDSNELPEPGDGDIVVDDEILHVHEYLGKEWTKMIVSRCGIVRSGPTCADLQICRWIRKQFHL